MLVPHRSLQTACASPFSSLFVLGIALALAGAAHADEVDIAEVAAPAPAVEEPEDAMGWRAAMTPFQAALFAPVQIFTPDTPVYGMRLSVLYGDQRLVYGLDAGAKNRSKDVLGLQVGGINWARRLYGLQIGGLNINDSEEDSLQIGARLNLVYGSQGRFKGLDLGLFSTTYADMQGVQVSVVNANLGTATGFQLGVGNSVQHDFAGFQLGLVNMVESKTTGAQIGVANSGGEDVRFQMGLWNYAKSLKGSQIGLINVNAARSPLLFMPVLNVGW